MKKLEHFNFWCQKVLPLVYDDSLSYYEVLCKVVEAINSIIEDSNSIITNIEELQRELAEVQEWIENFDKSYAKEVIQDNIATMIFVEITESGYIVYNIPDKWENITFNTTGIDIIIPCEPGYGKLVLSY